MATPVEVPILDLARYAARIRYTGEFTSRADVLKALHYAHVTHIPFENLDVLLRRPIRLDVPSLWAKMVEGGRGGYCFEQNALFAAVLEQAGFAVTRLAARVRMGASGIRARSHMMLMVEADGERWMCDVGFGGDGLLEPMPLRAGEVATQYAWKYRLVEEGPAFVFQTWWPDGWIDLYAFTLEPQFPVDYEVANWYTSTHPDSIFTKMLRVQLPGPERRVMLIERRLLVRTAEGLTETEVAEEDVAGVLLEFGLVWPSSSL